MKTIIKIRTEQKSRLYLLAVIKIIRRQICRAKLHQTLNYEKNEQENEKKSDLISAFLGSTRDS